MSMKKLHISISLEIWLSYWNWLFIVV